MINAQELRIGNWVYTHSFGVDETSDSTKTKIPSKIDTIIGSPVNQSGILSTGVGISYFNGHYVQELRCHESFESIEPIPLIPELLVKIGFYKDNYGVFIFVRDNAPYISGCDILFWAKECKKDGKLVWEFCIGKDLSDLTNLCYINNIHQLQNLYFALTNTELEIKL